MPVRATSQLAVLVSHQAGICRIGLDETESSIHDLRVHGVRGLRVAGIAVLPSPIFANANATVYAIAERAAALIQRYSVSRSTNSAHRCASHGPHRDYVGAGCHVPLGGQC